MEMKRFLLAVIIPALLLGCVKNPHPVVDPIDMNFDWKTTKSVSISVPSSDTKTSGEKGLIKIYKSGGYSESSLLASGVASGSSSFNTVIDLPIGLEEVFVKTIASNGLVSLSSYKVSGTKAYKNTSYVLSTKVGDYNPVDVPRPNIPTQFDREITSASQITGPITESVNVLIPAGVKIATNVARIFANYNQNEIPT